MFEAPFIYIDTLLSFELFLVMLIGVIVGLFIGAIPGLSPPMAIALMIPVSFTMPAEQAIVMMVATYAAGIYAGSFSAILLRAPGTSASAASAIEGFEMTIRGRAIEAIRISTFASVVGGLLSGLILLFLAQPLAVVSLYFGPSEYFFIAILGLMAIASVSFGSLTKGLISGFLGLILSTVGIDIYSGYPRFTFGVTELTSGIGLLPAIVGLFAFAQGLELALKDPHATISGVKSLSWRILPKKSEIWALRSSLVRGWITGLVLGIIPAAGASISQWIAYAWEIRRAKPGDRFGRGEPKGLAATEGANNGSTGTSLIPLFVLGIPGGISAAVIFGALIVHGLQPGMRLFTTRPEVIYTIMWGFIAANILMGLCAILFARLMAYVTVIPGGVVAPVILVFSVIGTYVESSSLFQVWVMMSFGVLGYFMYKYNFSPAGVLLGLILGPIAENGLRDMMVVSRGDVFSFLLNRPLSLLIIGLIIVLLFWSRYQEKMAGDIPEVDSEALGEAGPPTEVRKSTSR